MPDDVSAALKIGVLTALGLFSALSSVVLLLLFQHSGQSAFMVIPGGTFGAVISVYFIRFAGSRSIIRAFLLIAASSFAYSAAMMGGMWFGMFAVRDAFNDDSPGLPTEMVAPILMAGLIGGFVVGIAFLCLYAPEKWRKVLAKSFACSMAGGVLALVGWSLSRLVGEPVWSVLHDPTDNVATGNQFAFHLYSAWVVWQAGMGAVFGMVISGLSLRNTVAKMQQPTTKLHIRNVLLFGCMTLAVAWYVRRILPDEFRNFRRHRAYTKHVAEKPSVGGLPQIPIAGPEAMLLLNPIGQYSPRGAIARPGNYRSGPQPNTYGVRYDPPGSPDNEFNIGPHADVAIEEWPTADWAKWQIEDDSVFSSYSTSMEQFLLFGNQIRCIYVHNNRYEINYELKQSCAWISKNKVVRIGFFMYETNEFLQLYLQKYPSSL